MNQQSNIDFFPKWTCPHCDAGNDVTSPVRCWKCGNKKPTPGQWKEILKQKAEEKLKKAADKIAEKKAAMKIEEDETIGSSHIDKIPDVQDSHMEFDLTKLKKDVPK